MKNKKKDISEKDDETTFDLFLYPTAYDSTWYYNNMTIMLNTC
jgi:hypothetical protein